jgi:hypothetical protein
VADQRLGGALAGTTAAALVILAAVALLRTRAPEDVGAGEKVLR